jgi:polar amino acid transport system substrate-binding protein
VKDSVLVGQFPRPTAVTEFFGLVLEKNSPLTACVSAAVDSLYADGTLDALAAEWITDTGGAHVLD